LTTITGTLQEDQYIFFYHILLNSSDKSCRENQNTHFMFNNYFRKQCRLWDNV